MLFTLFILIFVAITLPKSLIMKHHNEKIILACRRAWDDAGRGRMLLAVSGGADSTALFLAFQKAGIPFEVAHCNFNLRGSESLRDREFVKVLCMNYGVRLHVEEFDAAKEARPKESVEMVCRRLRYDFFRKLKQKDGFARIVVAHNADDNVETFFINALRGSGSRGLRGMEADTGEILRPLLRFRHRDILSFLKENRQSYVLDSSNLRSQDFRRNFLRNEVFPLLESKWEGFYTAVATTMDIQARENRIVDHFTSQALEGVDDFLPWHKIYNFPDSETLIFYFIHRFGGSPDVAREMAASADSLMPGKFWNLNDEYTASFTRKGIQVSKRLPSEEPAPPTWHWEKLEGDALNMDQVATAPLSVAYLPDSSENYRWENADKKMRIKSLGMEGSQLVWKVLKDAGIPLAERRDVAVLVDVRSGEPVWIPGIKRSRLCLVAPDATSAYRLSLEGEARGGL